MTATTTIVSQVDDAWLPAIVTDAEQDVDDTIAWLVPAPDNTPAAETVLLNPRLAAPCPPYVLSCLFPSSLPPSQSQPLAALRIRLSTFPSRLTQLTVGTSLASVIVLPKSLPQLSLTHALFALDSTARLVLRDAYSARGSAVFFDGETCGDRAQGHEWLLGGGSGDGDDDDGDGWGAQAQGQVAVNVNANVNVDIDMQGVRFRVVFPERAEPPISVSMPKPIPISIPRSLRYSDAVATKIRVPQSLGSSSGSGFGTYLWDLARPWEPIVQIAG